MKSTTINLTKKLGWKLGIPLVILLLILLAFCLSSSKVDAPVTMLQLDTSLNDSTRYLSEKNYESQMLTIVEPYLDEVVTSGNFIAPDSASIYYEQYLLENPTGHIIISHGFSESAEKYNEVIYYYLNEGYSVHILEHRGHGRSQRYVDNPSKIHITSFDSFVSDLHQFITDYVQPANTNGSPLHLYAHSMGGGIAAMYLETYPETFSSAILSSPMLEINVGNYPELLAKSLTNIMYYLGQSQRYIFGHTDFIPIPDMSVSSASSESRYDYYFTKRINNEQLHTEGGTFGWLKLSLDACKQITKKEQAMKATTPILMFQSENDHLVKANGQYTFATHAPNTQLIFVEGAKHELFSTSNEIFVPYMNTILSFLEEHSR